VTTPSPLDRALDMAPRPGRPHLRGVVRGVHLRTEGGPRSIGPAIQILNFRVERDDEERGVLVPVEMIGRRLLGHLFEGDVVEVAGAWRSGTLTTDRVLNHTTGAIVLFGERSLLSFRPAWQKVLLSLAVAAVISGVTALPLLLAGGARSPSPEARSAARSERVLGRRADP
jgi:hypothetical protein